VLVTSRSPEPWLGEVRRLPVGGLTPREADEYADYLLAPYPAARPRRAVRAFGELLEWLDGHPLSMRLILPHLDTTDPSALLDALRGAAPLPGTDEADDGRLTSLSASIAYSYAHLSESARRLLPAVCLFQGVADEDVLVAFSAVPAVPASFAAASREDWRRVLEEAAGVGLLTSLGVGMYQIHPALPAYLAARWRQEEPEDHDALRDAATGTLVAAYADFGRWLKRQIESGDAGLAFTVIGLHRRTMGHLLGHALTRKLWYEARGIIEPLSSYLKARGLVGEADSWTDQVLLATEGADGNVPQTDTPAGRLWLFVVGEKADRQRARFRLDEAERTYDQIRVTLEAQLASQQVKGDLSVAYHQLGRVAQDGGRLGEAAEWYRKSLVIKEGLGDRQGVSASYHQLGVVAQLEGQLGQAAEWYRKSLVISEELGDRSYMATSYHELGRVAQDGGRLGEAAEWYRKSLAIEKDLGHRRGMARTSGQLGLLAEQQGEVQLALEWTVRCVTVFEQFPHPLTSPGPRHLARLTATLGMEVLEETWRQVTGNPLPDNVREYVSRTGEGDG
jgi:tetratricopeptide (TPR) repeat protein